MNYVKRVNPHGEEKNLIDGKQFYSMNEPVTLSILKESPGANMIWKQPHF